MLPGADPVPGTAGSADWDVAMEPELMRRAGWLVLVWLGLLPGVAQASYCDRVQGGDLNDPLLLLCEDFEAPTLHEDVSVGAGAPHYGPWYDDAGFLNARGHNSYWRRRYGSAVGACAWWKGVPASPTVGRKCGYDTCFQGEWRPDDRWQANSFACIDIVRNGEFNAEVPSLTSPIKPGGGSGVLEGTQSLAHRIGPGQTAGILGEVLFPAPQRTLGVTLAVAYPTNSAAAGANLWRGAWKHNEWGNHRDGLFMFHNGSALSEDDPFQHFLQFHTVGPVGKAACESAVKAATIRAGLVWCDPDVSMQYRPTLPTYVRSRDWPFGTWGCVRGHFINLGLANATIKIWFNNTLIIDFDVDSRFTTAATQNGIASFVWNAFTNFNDPNVGQTTVTTYRYEDNLHIRAGAPVSCAQIGFVPLVPTLPTAPAGLTVQ
jgi:hypothetical protein